MKKLEIALLGGALAVVIGCSAAGEASLQGLFTRLTLSFSVGDEVTEIHVQPGDTADASALEDVDGARFLYWAGPDGEPADPGVPAQEDAAYVAVLAPELASELTPWLSFGPYGLAGPETNVTGEELAAGVSSMFGGEVSVPELAALDEASEADLASALEGLFSPDALAGLGGTEPLTRMEAAQLICALAGIEPGTPRHAYAPDVDPSAPGAGALALCIDPAGAVRYDDGLVNIEGYLYYIDEGAFVRGGERGGLYFGEDGRYTSGNAELDEIVAETLEPICAEYSEREDMLRAAYLYVRDSFTYLRRNYYDVGADGWQIDEALTMFTTGRGNCYCYAAAFWALARGLGYDATAVAGTVGWDRSPHGWVIMYDDDGTRIIYDVELEMAYHYDRGRYDVDLYAMTPEAAYGWNYIYGAQFR